jgi:hypothetical protein
MVALACALTALSFGGQGAQGRNMREMDGSANSIEQGISVYLNGEEIKTILSPGEFCEWTLNMKVGQVVVGEARSDAFDPALEVVDHANKVVAQNDDRYPGDQRPLLFWRCDQEGIYALHLRCFHDKSGGQAFVRFKVYNSVDVPQDQKAEKEVGASSPFLMRIPMKAGEIKEILSDRDGSRLMFIRGLIVISPNGLPDPNLSLPIQPATNQTLVLAPVDGDYYLMAAAYGDGSPTGRIRIWSREVLPAKLVREGDSLTGKSTTGDIGLWELPVKAGDFIDVTTPGLHRDCGMFITEKPDVSKYDLTKPDLNPFYPQKPKQLPDGREAFFRRPARDRDNRRTVFYVWRDTTLWLASNGAGPVDKQYTVRVKPAAKEFVEDRPNAGKLQISNTDFWVFDAKAGDVMTLDTRATGFEQGYVVYDPDMREIRHFEAGIDQAEDKWRLIVQEPGRYRIAMACRGNGGGGEYTLTRKAIHAKEFAMGNPAKGDIAPGEVQIWKFTVKPNNPVLLHWNSTDWRYDVNIYDESGRATDFQRDDLDGHNKFGIVSRPTTYLIVLTGTGKASYSINLGKVPGFADGGK